MVEEILDEPNWEIPIDFQDEFGNALLHIACQMGSKKLLKICLRRGANINIQNLKGQTPLHFAARYGYMSLVQYLVSKGADDSILNSAGLTCYEGLDFKEIDFL